MPKSTPQIAALSLLALLALSACGSASASDNGDAATDTSTPTGPLSFAMPPGTDDPDTLSQMENVADHLATATGREVELQNPADYMAVVEAVRSGFVDVAVMSQFSTALSFANGSVEPLITWKSEQEPASLCIVLNDSPIQTIEDFRGGNIAFVDPGSTTGHFLPKSFLKQNGMTDGEDYSSVFAGGHDSAVLAMIEGSVDLVCTARMLLPMFEESGLLEAGSYRQIGETDPIPIGVSIVVNKDLDSETRDIIINNLPDLMIADAELATMFGGAEGYYTEPDMSVFEGLIQVAQDAGVDLEDMR